MKLSWNEIRQRAIQFSRNWEGVRREKAEAQTFWNEFFEVFGVRRRTVASFEEPVRSIKNSYGFIDLFWRGRLIAEHKSAGASLDKAASQAFQYVQDLASSGRDDEAPRYIILSDFVRIVLFDLEPEEQGELFHGEGYTREEFQAADLHKHVRHFAFITGQTIHRFREEDPANLEAAQIMADLHDAVEATRYDAAATERLMVRLLFCLFSEDTGIFEPKQFELYVEQHSREDGGYLSQSLNALFDILNTPEDKRPTILDEDLAAFPYVNGELFADRLPLAGFNRAMRDRLRAAYRFNWSRISPAIFGSLFQGIMDAKERRQIGAHYTSERDILKVIRPLFLDELREEFERIKAFKSKPQRLQRLSEFQQKLAKLNLLDPACGCGNFLVIAYRELRRLELEALKLLHPQVGLEELPLGELAKMSQVDVDQFYGIEIGEWPSRIAETALWLTDHQMNIELGDAFGNVYQRIPLRAAPHIRCANALRIDWNDVLPASECSYVLGNPPFVGAKFQDADQKADVRHIAGSVENSGLLDYVALWYFRASEYSKGLTIRCAFVSTNSISQGEQVGALWSELFKRGIRIHFAHRTFSWQSEAKGKAHVHVVIIGFGLGDVTKKKIFEYDDIKGEPHQLEVNVINPYLVDGPFIILSNRSNPLCHVSEMRIGNKPIDGGHYLFNPDEKREFLLKEPKAEKYFRRWMGAEEFINAKERWGLWLGDCQPKELRQLPLIRERVERVFQYRSESKSAPTNRLAQTPTRFHVETFPQEPFVVVPEVSSERRRYIPIGIGSSAVLYSNKMRVVPDAGLFSFGVLMSEMHMAWTRQVCGRLKSDFQYSVKLVYNNYPWPMDATAAQRAKVEECAQAVLDARQPHLEGGSCLADLYDPLYMPGDLLKAHQALDRAVDRCYRKEAFGSERERVEFLFRLYEELTSPLAMSEPARRKRGPRRGK